MVRYNVDTRFRFDARRISETGLTDCISESPYIMRDMIGSRFSRSQLLIGARRTIIKQVLEWTP